MATFQKKVEQAVVNIIQSEQQLTAIKPLSKLYETHPDLSKDIRAFAILLGNTIQTDDLRLQETAHSELYDKKNDLRSRIVQALDEADPKEYRRRKSAKALFNAHAKSHTDKADNIINNIEKFWTDHLKSELQNGGKRGHNVSHRT